MAPRFSRSLLVGLTVFAALAAMVAAAVYSACVDPDDTAERTQPLRDRPPGGGPAHQAVQEQQASSSSAELHHRHRDD